MEHDQPAGARSLEPGGAVVAIRAHVVDVAGGSGRRDLNDSAGAYVGSMSAEAPASRAGMRRGDVTIAVDGHRVVVRNDRPQPFPMTLGDLPNA